MHFVKRTIISSKITPKNSFKNRIECCGFNIQHKAIKNKIIPNVSYKIIVSVIGVFTDFVSPEMNPTTHKPIIWNAINPIDVMDEISIEVIEVK
jgi:hypothetical protein